MIQVKPLYSITSVGSLQTRRFLPCFYRRIIPSLILCILFASPASSGESQNFINPENYTFRNINIDDGLSQNLVSCIYQDHAGFIWIGTKGGLNLFDGNRFKVFKYDPSDKFSLTDNYITCIYEDMLSRLWVGTNEGGIFYLDRQNERFINFNSDPEHKERLSDNHIRVITGDRYGNIWIGTGGGGLNLLSSSEKVIPPDRSGVSIIRYNEEDQGFPEDSALVNTLLFDSDGHLWVGTSSNIFRYGGPEDPVFRKIDVGLPTGDTNAVPEIFGEGIAGGRRIFEDSGSRLWMVNIFGLFTFESDKNCFTRYNHKGVPFPARNIMAATSFRNRGKEEIWVGSEDSLYILDPASGEFSGLSSEKDLNLGLKGGWFSCFFTDMGGTLWIGSNGRGLTLFNPSGMKFRYPDDKFIQGSWISSGRKLSVRSFCVSSKDNNILWLGSNEGLFRVNRSRSALSEIKIHGVPYDRQLIIYHLCEDEKGLLWIATNIGLVRYDAERGKQVIYRSSDSPSMMKGESDVIYYVLCNGSDVWVLTDCAIARFDRVKGIFQKFKYDSAPDIRKYEMIFPSLLEDKKGNLWIAAKNGLHYFNTETNKLKRYKTAHENSAGRVSREVNALLSDPVRPDKYIWFGTDGNGFCRLDIRTGKIKFFTEKEGLANNIVYGLLADDEGNFWISTNEGLSSFNPRTIEFTNYTTADGLQSNEFNRGAYYKSREGEMFFGGIEGYNCFFPQQIIQRKYMSPVVFTRLQIFEKNHLNITKNAFSILESSHLKLAYNQNHFTVDFASLDFASAGDHEFAYNVEPSLGNWIPAGSQNSLTLAELKAGNYVLTVKGTNSDRIWSDKTAVLYITIEGPWWQKPWIFPLYFIFLLVLILGLRNYELSRIRLRNRMRIATIESDKLKEIDRLKSRFFANISHEFRTPLTLIKGPLEKLIDGNTDIKSKKMLALMELNTDRLLRLINQLLELSKFESGMYSLDVKKADIIAFTERIASSFSSLADEKKIDFSVVPEPDAGNDELRTGFYFDADIIEKILTNLVSNAFKFTPAGGRIVIRLRVLKADNRGKMLEIQVEDTGTGIRKDQLPYIFDRFYQAGKRGGRAGGSGIGLAYVLELVKIHRGEINVSSEECIGTVFTARFPFGIEFLSDARIPFESDSLPVKGESTDLIAIQKDLADSRLSSKAKPKSRLWILIVEDHPQVSEYIKDNLKDEYRIIQAFDGNRGLAMAEEFIPDLIISDIMMPGIDGYSFCTKIKNNEKTSHIPVILLTARADITDRIKGLDTGADDFLVKPFNAKELAVRVRNLIKSRIALREKFSSNSIIRPGEITVSPFDEDFMQRMLKLVEENIAVPGFSVEDLAREAGMSQSQMHRKFKAVINTPANHFIRSVRMNRAMTLLQEGAGNISEVAYMIGYDDPGYFSKSFQKFYGKPPSAILKK